MNFLLRLRSRKGLLLGLLIPVSLVTVYFTIPLQSVSIQVEYSDLQPGVPRTFVLLLDGKVVARTALAGTGYAPEVKDLGVVKLRGGPHTLLVTLAEEILLEESFFHLGQGYLWIGVWDEGARFGLEYQAPLWA